ncbi:MAG TPA: metallopeptidase TldD-related protein, partial [Casimicrobiaceae bacterium]|nr:metallopeptidase TldD-related protein [Casimicrobiaceae bacterium]
MQQVARPAVAEHDRHRARRRFARTEVHDRLADRLLRERVAAPGVTVVDDGTLGERRGSLNLDDEGHATQRTVLIEDGVLRGYMQDRLNSG